MDTTFFAILGKAFLVFGLYCFFLVGNILWEKFKKGKEDKNKANNQFKKIIKYYNDMDFVLNNKLYNKNNLSVAYYFNNFNILFLKDRSDVGKSFYIDEELELKRLNTRCIPENIETKIKSNPLIHLIVFGRLEISGEWSIYSEKPSLDKQIKKLKLLADKYAEMKFEVLFEFDHHSLEKRVDMIHSGRVESNKGAVFALGSILFDINAYGSIRLFNTSSNTEGIIYALGCQGEQKNKEIMKILDDFNSRVFELEILYLQSFKNNPAL